MPKRALIDHRPWLLASLAAAISYFFFRDNPIPGTFLIVWKGAAVGLLAGYAYRRSTGIDGWLISTALATAALGDMALELDLLVGGAVFAVAHFLTIALFVRNVRPTRSVSQKLTSAAIFAASPLITSLVVYPDPRWLLATAYAAIVGLMAATAWTSRFPRYRVGIGAVLFVASDLLIFSREAERLPDIVSLWLVWPLYYVGQFLIATGVVRALRHKHR